MMKKQLSCLLLMCLALRGQTITMATLEKIPSNTLLGFQTNNHRFYCQQYGIYDLDSFTQQKKVEPYCINGVKRIQKKYPLMQYFGQKHLKIYQNYHIVFFKESCQLFSDGPKSYAEVLVENGLAVVKPKFKNRDYYYYLLQKAQTRAKINKIGIWEVFGMNECVQSLYKEE